MFTNKIRFCNFKLSCYLLALSALSHLDFICSVHFVPFQYEKIVRSAKNSFCTPLRRYVVVAGEPLLWVANHPFRVNGVVQKYIILGEFIKFGGLWTPPPLAVILPLGLYSIYWLFFGINLSQLLLFTFKGQFDGISIIFSFSK